MLRAKANQKKIKNNFLVGQPLTSDQRLNLLCQKKTFSRTKKPFASAV